MQDVAARRLRAQGLIGKPFRSAAEAVGRLGAVQSQDYPAAKWALGQRTGLTDADLDRFYDEGTILRTHVLRPTWHFVLPDDIRWIQELTSARVIAGMRGRFRQLELDEATIARATDVLGEALSGGRHLTRPELAEVLQAAGIAPDGQRAPHLLAAAEHANVITSGPRRGKQMTYALLAERAPNARSRDRDDALRELVTRYFRSHGPAQVRDFVWWSGMTASDARHGIAMAGDALQRETIAGQEHWSAGDSAAPGDLDPRGHLLPNFDEFTVAYRDRSAVFDPALPYDPSFFTYYRDASPQGGMLSNIVTIVGRLRGAWSRTLTAEAVRVEVRPLAPFTADEEAAIAGAAERYARFLGRRLDRWGDSRQKRQGRSAQSPA